MTRKTLTSGAVAMLACMQFSCALVPGRGAPSRASDRPTEVMLRGLEAQPLWNTRVGTLVAAARYLKYDAPAAWIYGATGHAFALNIHESICPSGPTAWPTEATDLLATNLGLVVERHVAHASDPDIAARQEVIWTKVKLAIDEKLPCIAWWMDHGEWYLVVGYESKGNYVYDDYGTPGRKHYATLADNPTGIAAVGVVVAGQGAGHRPAVREALRFAIAHGQGEGSHEEWHTGLAGYDTWIKALSDETVPADKAVGFGQAYNAQCWAEARRHAVTFLEQAEKRLADPVVTPLLSRATNHYRTVSRNLDIVAETFPFDGNDRQAMEARIADPARRAKALAALTAARTAEAAALEALVPLVKALQ